MNLFGIIFNILVDTVLGMKQYEDKWSHDFFYHAEKKHISQPIGWHFVSKRKRISMQMRRQRLPHCIIDEVQQLIPI